MKKKFILLPFVGALLYVTLSGYRYGPAYGGLGDLTGSSSSTVPGCSCHNPTPTSTTAVTVQLLSGSTVVTSYVPGTTYRLKIHAVNNSSSTLPNFGFQMSVVKLSGAGSGSAVSAGTYGAASSGTHVQAVGSLNVFEHYNASFGDGSIAASSGSGSTGSTYDTSISWTAPTAGTGSVVIYGVANLVNHDGSAGSPDQWNSATPVTICEAPAAITGIMSVCAGSTTTLSDATSGGTWSSGSTLVATVGPTGIVTGVGTGTAAISYATSCGTSATTVTVNLVPSSITGLPFVCPGATTALSEVTPGGSWSSVSPSVATISGSGSSATATGVATAGGTALISYRLPVTGCAATLSLTVNPAPPAISGIATMCQGGTTTLTDGSGGSWTSSATSVATVGSASGIVTGVVTSSTSAATAVITYTSSSGCTTTKTVTVNPLPTVPAITGTTSVCQGATTTLSDGTSGGAWSSGSTAVVVIGSTSGVVTGVATGSTSPATSLITYSVTNGFGCSSNATTTVTVNPLPVVAAIGGTASVCQGAITILTDATSGGSWSSGATGVATVAPGSGSVTGVLTGSTSTAAATISYSVTSAGCTNTATATVTVNPLPAAITGPGSVCAGSSATLSDGTSGGSWSSGSTGIATVGPGTGVVTGGTSGTSVITYSLLTGCVTTTTVTVNPLPAVAAITGVMNVCAGATTTLADATPGGSWSIISSLATVGSTGIVTGVSAGAPTISYSVTSGVGCTNSTTTVVNVNALPAAIGGATSVCPGATATVTDGTFGGAWSSSNTALATIGTTGIVSGLTTGTDTVSYTLPSGCGVSKTFTVNASPSDFAPAPVCVGSALSLSSSPSGGIWTSGSTGTATIGSSSGIVTGVAAGSAAITYSITGGCSLVRTQSVIANPLPISGPTPGQVCATSSISLSDATSGGTWSSSSTSLATVGSTGSVTGVASGTPVISYVLGSGCMATKTVTVNPLPSSITGPPTVCVGQTTALGDLTSGGAWASGSTLVASAGAGTGIVTGISAGTSTISYTIPVTGCMVTYTITVNALSAISGLTSLCAGSATTLTDGTAGGTWTSSNTAAATIGPSSGLVTAIAPGSTTITYSLPSGCSATSTVTVISSPSPISGPSSACIGTTITLTDPGGGTWSSSNPSVAAIGASTGIVTPLTTGTVTITYSLGSGCTVTTPVTVNAAASPVTGTASVCVGATTTLSDGGGGTWSSSSGSATVGTTGIVTGVTAGSSVITYTLGTGCIATRTVTVNPVPAGIIGILSACVGATTSLSDGTSGGAWSSLSGTIASVGATTGIVTGIASGTATIKYSFTATGCAATAPVTVNPAASSITGAATVCVGSAITLSDAGGGTWSSSNTNATVASTGVVIGVTSGTSVITYLLGTGCFSTKTITINPLPAAISGSSGVCIGGTITLSDLTSGGTWGSSGPALATVGATSGIVTGVAAGTPVISYTLSATGCFSIATVTVNPLPALITGTTHVCVGATTTLADAGGGTWSSGTPGVATAGATTGIITGIAAGTATIIYSLPTGCTRTTPVTVNPLPFAISGSDSICIGSSVTLIDAGGGTWSSGAPGIATAGTSSGVISGIAAGTSVVTYILPTGCSAHVTVTVNLLPSAITGTDSVCAGSSVTLSDGTPGGAWSSSGTATAIAGSTGIILGVAAGSATISYTISTGCTATVVLTVNPMPSAITGTTHVCQGSTVLLTDAGGGAWASGTVSVATIGATTGIVSGIAAGTTAISYTLGTGCTATATVTVNPLPFAGGITGAAVVCADSTITLADTIAGGVWSSVTPSVATVGTATGIISGISAGTDTIKYSVANSCGIAVVVKAITINPLPVAGTVTGPSIICLGPPVTLTDAATGGIWSSSNTAVATIGAGSGAVTPVAIGTTTVSYSVTNGCGTAIATATDTVLSLPSVDTIVGPDSVCEGDTMVLGDLVPDGSWSASNGNATVDMAGVVTGVTAGTDTIRYTVTGICGPATAGLLINIRSHAVCYSGVQRLPDAGVFKVYPNPSNGSFTVEIPATEGGAALMLTDALGQVIETKNTTGANPQKVVFNVYDVAAGSYILKVSAGNSIYREKIVIW